MNILVIGKGGREHALAWKMKKSPLSGEVYVAPGNDGMHRDGLHTLPLENYDFEKILSYVKKYEIKLVLVGPEDWLAAGVSDFLEANSVAVFGPNQKAAQLESSKIFAKKILQEFKIPTAKFFTCDSRENARQRIEECAWQQGVVLKKDGLAGGKGVIVCGQKEEALKALNHFEISPESPLLLEECLQGYEVSSFFLCSGGEYQSLGEACDYKRLLDDDQGPNTGGMGTFTGQNLISPTLKERIEHEIVKPLLQGLKSKEISYHGVLFIGIMVDAEGPKVLEFNVRFGDPETQVLLPAISSDLLPHFMAVAEKKILNTKINKDRSCVHVVMASEGYPGFAGKKIELDREISVENKEGEGFLFYAGVKEKDGVLYTAGGRVLGVSACDGSLEQARLQAYAYASKISFRGKHMRSDIAKQHGVFA